MVSKITTHEIIKLATRNKNLHAVIMAFITVVICLITSTINFIRGYQPYDLILSIFGLVYVMVVYLFFFRKHLEKGAIVLLLIYFAFVLTPFIWYFFDGLTTHTTYVIITVTAAIIIYTDGRVQKILLALYFLTVIIYSISDLFFSSLPQHETLVELITFSIANGILILLISREKKINEHVHYQLNDLSFTDEMTKTYNHRYISTILTELKLHSECDYVIGIYDIDNFKSINDTYGHLEGDEALQQVCDLTRKHLRSQDIFGRYGGDEFIIIMRHTTIEDARKIATRICRAIETGTKRAETTISIGLCARESTDSARATLTQADKALYRAKQSGKNRISS